MSQGGLLEVGKVVKVDREKGHVWLSRKRGLDTLLDLSSKRNEAYAYELGKEASFFVVEKPEGSRAIKPQPLSIGW